MLRIVAAQKANWLPTSRSTRVKIFSYLPLRSPKLHAELSSARAFTQVLEALNELNIGNKWRNSRDTINLKISGEYGYSSNISCFIL
jgi:hypothetical protein